MHLQFYFSSECVSPDRFIPLYDHEYDADNGQVTVVGVTKYL